MSTSAKIIADSVSPQGCRLTTMEVCFHRFVLAEFNTHRMFSRNSASSRAIPFKKQLKRVTLNPAIPVKWAAEQPGMQGGDEIENPKAAEAEWLAARDAAVAFATGLAENGVHKSIVNRLLEPFMWHTVIVSATEWENFFRQRCSPLAQPEIRAAAECMQQAYEGSVPAEIDYGQWHMPYVDTVDYGVVLSEFHDQADAVARTSETLRKVSVGRCARVSYLTHDGIRDWWEDVNLYERLISADPPHASPLEHVATPTSGMSLGNFTGWSQLRHEVLGF